MSNASPFPEHSPEPEQAPAPEPGEHPDQVAFWQGRYESGQLGWDLGGPSPHFVQFLQDNPDLPRGKVAVLGAGRGHDAALFARAGFDVTAFDYAPGAIAGAQTLYGDQVDWRQADIFTLGGQTEFSGAFDAVVEHTCFCAISPRRRQDYVRTVACLLRPGGEYWAVFWQHGEWGGPPYSSTPDEIRTLFGESFDCASLTPMSNTAAGRSGTEWLARFVRKALPAESHASAPGDSVK